VAVVDVVVVVLAVAAAARGWRRGLLGQAFEFGGGLVGLIAGVAVGARVASSVTNSAGIEGALIALLVVLVALSTGQMIGHAVGRRSGALARRAHFGGVDSALGSMFGVAVTVVSFWLLGSLLAVGPIPEIARQLRRSELLRAMNVVAEPPDVLASVGHYLDASGFPQVFSGSLRSPAPQVDLPDNAVARRAARSASPSIVRVVAPGCGGTQLGSGWIAAPSTVVTNAHVVAGGASVTVSHGDSEHAGSVVVFDPDADIAVIRAEGLEGPVLELTERRPDRGALGVTLGFPGGGDGLEAHRAAIRERFEARGLDIYGRDFVRREIYELRARVRQGDSGGPFVLRNGRVAGVVFAASTTDADTGYALTGAEVSGAVGVGANAEDPVDTGPCTH
jgi:S1-C subfamily serine protease